MPFAIGSHTKMFVAAVIYQPQEEGLLSTSDPVSKYLPDEISLFPRSKDATIDQLLTHAAAIPDFESSQNPASRGRRWHDPVRERILEPLGMKDTVLVPRVAPAELRLPSGYFVSPFKVDTSGWNYSQADAAGSGASTAMDLATFVQAYYSGKLFKDPATLKGVLALIAPWFEDFSEDHTYLHGGFDKKGFLGHGGGTPGFASDAGYDPERNMTIVVWSNASESGGGQGVIEVAHAVGLAPSMDEVLLQTEVS